MNASPTYIPRHQARHAGRRRHAVGAPRFDWAQALRIGMAATAVAVTCLVIWAVTQAVPAESAEGIARTDVVVVQPGDTLWSIAKRVGGEARDPRVVIEQIRNMNDIEGSVIWPGQQLVVPTDV